MALAESKVASQQMIEVLDAVCIASETYDEARDEAFSEVAKVLSYCEELGDCDTRTIRQLVELVQDGYWEAPEESENDSTRPDGHFG